MDSDEEVQETIYSCVRCGEELAEWIPCDCDADTTICVEMTGEALVRISMNVALDSMRVVFTPSEARRFAIVVLEECERADMLARRLGLGG